MIDVKLDDGAETAVRDEVSVYARADEEALEGEAASVESGATTP